MRQNLNFKSNEIIKQIYDCAMEVYGHGIAVPVDIRLYHPCGYDWIDFSDVYNEEYQTDILNYRFTKQDISNCCGSDEYLDKTLKEILEVTGGKFAFEVRSNDIDWFRD